MVRRGLIMKEAAVFFSEFGFAASTRDLADRLGVRQALLYKYFTSKEALIDEVFGEAFSEHWTRKWVHAISDNKLPLTERLAAFYSQFMEDGDRLRLRLFLRGALDGYPLPARMAPFITDSLVKPLVAALRKVESLPDLAAKPLMIGERELVMMLHGAMVFHQIRDEVYKAQTVKDHAAVASLYINLFLQSASATLRNLHSDKAPAALTQG